MSNKIKLSKKKRKRLPKIKKIDRPSKIAFTQHLGDFSGCGNIRIVYPSLLLNTYYNPVEKLSFESIYTNRYNPDPRAYKQCLFVVFQRSSTKEQLEIIKHFKKTNPKKVLVYECDDDLFNIPEWNFASPFYKDNRKYIEEIVSLCSGVTVSTEYLKKLFLPYNSNISVIPNHLPKFLWGNASFNLNVDGYNKPRICYPGSFNHFDQKSDKGDFDKDLIEFVKNTTDKYQWVFVGGMPLSLQGNKDIEYHGWQGVLEFPRFIRDLNIDIMLAPLEDIEFNKSKSNIKALEATVIGVPLVCSNVEPYKGLPGTCDTTEYMIHQIEMLASNSDLRQDMWSKQYDILKEQLYWEENDNVLKYVDSFLHLIRMKL
jgi:glycosyltransferase involved in cell wall biosynthesis